MIKIFGITLAVGITIALLITQCAAPPPNQDVESNPLKATVEAYIQTYQERADWEAFLSFYSDSVLMKDILLDLEFQGKEAFAAFYDWPNPAFEKLYPGQKTFELEEVVIQENIAAIRGTFTPFIWKKERQDWAGGFTIWLYFDEGQKIIQQVDYIKYPKRFLPDE